MTEETELKPGLTLLIRRTNGIEHDAIVSDVNYTSRSVQVEWSEDGETRGKEIDFDTVFALNSHLASHGSPEKEALEESKIVRNPSRSSVPIHRSASFKHGLVQSAIPTSSTFAAITSRGVENSTSLQQICGTNGNNECDQRSAPNLTSQFKSSADSKDKRLDKKNRPSNVVKEIGKLKKDREERRQRQAETKVEKKALMNVDPGNPNWKFLSMIREYQAVLEIRPLRTMDSLHSNHQITVCVRKRPLNRKETNRKEIDVITIPRKDTIVVHEPKQKVDLTKYLENQQFRFDYVFDDTCSNELVYHYTARPLVQTIFDGGMATCFAYGQTGSGKTHTMGGTFSGKLQDSETGVYGMVANDVFQFLNTPPYKYQKLCVTSSFFEIYSGKVFDLLAGKAKLRVLEDGKQQVQIVGLTEKDVKSKTEVLSLIAAGNATRTSGKTSANLNSSRSHAVFQLTLRTLASRRLHGKFSLIDLAGNERGADTMSADRLTRMEGAEINKSLLALKECIRALGRKGAHLPFRASKLTQVLRDSFIGDNSRTCMVAMVSPGMNCCEHSLNTLRYADRVKELASTTDFSNIEEEAEKPEVDQGSELGTLRFLNPTELSPDLYNFHEAVSQLEQLEDCMLDTFKIWIDAREGEDQLMHSTLNVDYDQESFASQLDKYLEDRFKLLVTLKDKVKAFRKQLAAEEEISKRILTPSSSYNS